jgi:heptosyltransferase-2
MKILIIQKKFMGDILVSSTTFPLLKKKFPDAEITFLLEEKHQQILKGNPYLDHVISWNDRSFVQMIQDIRKQKFDIVIDLYSKIDTGLLAIASGAKIRIGFFKKYTQFFYTHPVKRRKMALSENTTLGIEHRLQLLEPLDIKFEEVFPKTYILENELENAKNILTQNGLTPKDNLVMISTFGSTEEKTYPLEYMAEILDEIVECKADSKILCNYLPFQKELFNQLYNQVLPKTQAAIVKDFDTKNLREFAAVTSLCKCLIGNEGGATNLSKSLDIPTFTIFAPHIELKGWAWTSNSKMDRFLHLNDFVPESTNYSDFKPELFENQLKDFLNQVLN